MKERLQKYLARCGVASRRQSEEFILEGKVEVDGETVTELGTKIDPDVQVVSVVGERVAPAAFVYYAVHKPRGVVCSHRDPAGRPLAVDLVPHRGIRLFPIGRLDEDSEGLLLLTNDGELAERVAHPRFQVAKKYHVTVKGTPDQEAMDKLRNGVWLSEGKTGPSVVQILRKTREQTQLLITLHEGKKRHIRRILARVELPVRRLTRVQVGPVRLGTLKKGQWRILRKSEIVALRDGSETAAERPGKPVRGRPGAKASARRPSSTTGRMTATGRAASAPKPAAGPGAATRSKEGRKGGGAGGSSGPRKTAGGPRGSGGSKTTRPPRSGPKPRSGPRNPSRG